MTQIKELASYLEVLRAAKNMMQTQDLFLSGRLSRHPNLGYEAIRHACTELLGMGAINIDEGKLSLGVLNRTEWLEQMLVAGETAAWDLVELFPVQKRKYEPDLELLKEIGLRGEQFILGTYLEILPEQMHVSAVHTSLTDDSAGFDISVPSPQDFNRQLHLEIKSSTRPDYSFEFYLSRNEARQALRDPNWFMVFVKLGHEVKTIGYLDGKNLGEYLPRDRDEKFAWQSVRGRLTQDEMYPGLPGTAAI